MISRRRPARFSGAALSVFALLVVAACAGPPSPTPSAAPRLADPPLTVVVRAGERPSGGDPYAGSDACRPCHADIHAFWQGTLHSRSMLALGVSPGRDETPCLRCHTTGYGEATGYGRGGGDLGSVGCEACHGPSALHAADPGKKATPTGLRGDCPPCIINRVCRLCHTPAWSARFDLDQALGSVRCPKYGRE
jgi:hypothetical protein